MHPGPCVCPLHPQWPKSSAGIHGPAGSKAARCCWRGAKGLTGAFCSGERQAGSGRGSEDHAKPRASTLKVPLGLGHGASPKPLDPTNTQPHLHLSLPQHRRGRGAKSGGGLQEVSYRRSWLQARRPHLLLGPLWACVSPRPPSLGGTSL